MLFPLASRAEYSNTGMISMGSRVNKYSDIIHFYAFYSHSESFSREYSTCPEIPGSPEQPGGHHFSGFH
jgi:hypothetical protein